MSFSVFPLAFIDTKGSNIFSSTVSFIVDPRPGIVMIFRIIIIPSLTKFHAILPLTIVKDKLVNIGF